MSQRVNYYTTTHFTYIPGDDFCLVDTAIIFRIIKYKSCTYASKHQARNRQEQALADANQGDKMSAPRTSPSVFFTPQYAWLNYVLVQGYLPPPALPCLKTSFSPMSMATQAVIQESSKPYVSTLLQLYTRLQKLLRRYPSPPHPVMPEHNKNYTL